MLIDVKTIISQSIGVRAGLYYVDFNYLLFETSTSLERTDLTGS